MKLTAKRENGKVSLDSSPSQNWEEYQKKRQKLYLRAVHKGLDIPEDEDMSYTVNNTATGISWKEILAGGAVVAAMAIGVGYVASLFVPRASAPSTSVEDAEYDVFFYDAEGNPIDVEPFDNSP